MGKYVCKLCEELKKLKNKNPKLYLGLKISKIGLVYFFVLGFGFVLGLLIWGVVANLRPQSQCPLEVVILYILGYVYGILTTLYLLRKKINFLEFFSLKKPKKPSK